MGPTNFLKEEEDGFEGPGKSWLRDAFAEMMMLYVINAADKTMTSMKKMFPIPIIVVVQLVLEFMCVTSKGHVFWDEFWSRWSPS